MYEQLEPIREMFQQVGNKLKEEGRIFHAYVGDRVNEKGYVVVEAFYRPTRDPGKVILVKGHPDMSNDILIHITAELQNVNTHQTLRSQLPRFGKTICALPVMLEDELERGCKVLKK
jgi:hypothetical protein